VKFYTMENVGAGNLSMPEQEMHTTAFWLRFPELFFGAFSDLSPLQKQNGLTGVGNALRTVGALLLMSDPRDLGVAITDDGAAGKTWQPNLFLYDNYPGGIGQSAPLFHMAEKLLAGATELIEKCRCEAGCPACTGPAEEIGEKGKEVALRLLKEALQPRLAAVSRG